MPTVGEMLASRLGHLRQGHDEKGGSTRHELVPRLEDFGLEELGGVVRGEGLVDFEFGDLCGHWRRVSKSAHDTFTTRMTLTVRSPACDITTNIVCAC